MENYFWNTESDPVEKKLYILVIYDIVSNKRRVAFAKKNERLWVSCAKISV